MKPVITYTKPDARHEAELSKRTYFPGYVLEVPCVCGQVMRRDFGRDYLSSPTPNQPVMAYVDCVCGNEAEVPIVVRMSIEIVESEEESER